MIFAVIYIVIILLLHLYLPFFRKSNDQWNDKIFSQTAQAGLFPDNIKIIDIDHWPYYKDNRDEAQQARNDVITHMIRIIDLLNKDPKNRPPFIGIDMTFESKADDAIMVQLFKRVEANDNIYLSVEFDREKKTLIIPGNDFWKRIMSGISRFKERLMVINLEKYRNEPVRRYRGFYHGTVDNSKTEQRFPSMAVVLARMIEKHFLGGSGAVEMPETVSRFKYRYLIGDIKADYGQYSVFSMERAERKIEAGDWKKGLDNSIVLIGRMDPDPDGRDRSPVCASVGGHSSFETLPGVMIHLNAAMSVLFEERISVMGNWAVLGYLVGFVIVLIVLHVVLDYVVKRFKPSLSHWYGEIFLFFAVGLLVWYLDRKLRGVWGDELEVPMFTFYMMVLYFYPSLGVWEWLIDRKA